MDTSTHPHWPVHLREFCLAHEAAFLVPAEAFTAAGLLPEFATALAHAGRATAAQLECLSRGFVRYWQRCQALHEQAPRWWFAPRATNVLVVNEPAAVAPYVVPFAGTSSLLALSDLDTEPEFVAYLFAHNERLPLVGSLRGSHVANLSWWLRTDASARAEFTKGAGAARRPDAPAFVALARALRWIDCAYHDPLRLPGSEGDEHRADGASAPDAAAAPDNDEPYFGLNGTGLALPRRRQPDLEALCAKADRAQAQAVATQRPLAAARQASLDSLCDWLCEQRAHLDITAADGSRLWQAGGRDPSRLRATLRQNATDAAVRSLTQDFAVVHERSTMFLDALRDPQALPTDCAVLESAGSAYIDPARRAIVYPLRPSAFDPRVHAAPPYHRLLLGARVMHEWGHLAHTAKILHLPEAQRERYRAARQRLGATFLELVRSVPAALQGAVQHELGQLVAAGPAGGHGAAADPAAALARKTLARVGDYLANMMCARFIPPSEMQAYVRTNVRHHLDEELGLVAELARCAYEVHYLPLAGLPRSYFFETSRFRRSFIDSGIFDEARVLALFDAAGEVLACYAVDTQRLRLPAPPELFATAAAQRGSDSTRPPHRPQVPQVPQGQQLPHLPQRAALASSSSASCTAA